MKLKVGDHVQWDTSSHGVNIKRIGEIVYTIEPFTSLFDIIENGELAKKFGKNFTIIYNKLGDFKAHESFLVITRKRDSKIPILYWPDVNILKKTSKIKFKHNSVKIKEN